ncbi:MAG: hypothetical protein IH936_11615, partial [Acidobacteria bacterium]|nr:hypothetical protein [Acidobacteriota bacterium]
MPVDEIAVLIHRLGLEQKAAGLDEVLLVAPPAWSQSPTHLWSESFGDISTNEGRAIAVDEAGNVVLAGSFEATVAFDGGFTSAGDSDIFVAKFNPDTPLYAQHLWSRRFGDTGLDVGYAIAIDGDGNVIVTGSFERTVNFGGGPRTSAGSSDIFVAKYDAGGNHLWSQRFGDTGPDVGHAIAIDGSGNV